MLYPGERCARVLAHVPTCVAMVDPLVKGFKFLPKKAVLRSNRDLFRRLEILAVAEVTILLLTDRAQLGHVKFVHTRMVPVIARHHFLSSWLGSSPNSTLLNSRH